jgi:protein SCO1/2
MRMFAVRAIVAVGVVAVCAFLGTMLWRADHRGHFAVAPNFSLVDDRGRPFELAQERGRPVVLFFGYTHCPDICPTTLAAIAHARSALGAPGLDIAVLFVTVDPQRDTPLVLQRYVALFDRSFVGLTGSPAQLAPVYDAFHVYHEIVPSKDTAAGYLVTHSAAVYFIARDGHIQEYGDWTDGRDILTKHLQEILS